MTDWLRLWHDMPTDPKWRTIARKSRQRIGDVIAVWTFVMVNASANATERGRTLGLDCEDIGIALDLESEAVEAIIAAMQGKVLDGDRLSGWDRRQPKREDNSAERAKKWREQKNANAPERSRTHANAPERPEQSRADSELAKASRAREPKAGDASPRPESPAGMPDDLRQVMQAANMTAPPPDLALLHAWKADGIPLATVLPVARRIAERENSRGKPVRKLKYLDDAVREQHAADLAEVEHFREVSARYGGATQ